MKAAIVTLTHVQNYGNRLQNYALQKVMENMEVKTETIFNDMNGTKARIKRDIKRNIKRVITGKYTCIDKRIDRFNSFNNQYIKASKFIADACEIDTAVDSEYNFFIAGSDQIWNPNYNYTPYYFLQFASQKKRNVYAGSFGVSVIDEDKRANYAKWLSELNKISVRENNGVEIVRNLTNRDSVNVLDPTLLLNADEWMKIEYKPDGFMAHEYVLVYFLGDIPKRVQEYIDELKDAGKEIVYLEGDTTPLGDIKNPNGFSYDPREFVWLIHNCSAILTDSFHGTVFSVIFNRDFYVFDRSIDVGINKMGSRLQSLLGQLSLANRYNPGGFELGKDHDYSQAYVVIENEKEKSLSYLYDVIREYK